MVLWKGKRHNNDTFAHELNALEDVSDCTLCLQSGLPYVCKVTGWKNTFGHQGSPW